MTPQDLKQIDELFSKRLIDFEEKFEKKFDDIKKSIGDSKAAIISTITNNFVKKDELTLLEKRVTKLEKALEY